MAVWLVVAHIVSLLLLPLLHLPLWLTLTLLSAVLCSLLDSWRRQASRNHPDAVRCIIWKSDGHCQLMLNSGRQQHARLTTQAFIQPWLVVLHFRHSRQQVRYLPVLADMVDDEAFRQLRVRLRIFMDKGAL